MWKEACHLGTSTLLHIYYDYSWLQRYGYCYVNMSATLRHARKTIVDIIMRKSLVGYSSSYVYVVFPGKDKSVQVPNAENPSTVERRKGHD